MILAVTVGCVDGSIARYYGSCLCTMEHTHTHTGYLLLFFFLKSVSVPNWTLCAYTLASNPAVLGSRLLIHVVYTVSCVHKVNLCMSARVCVCTRSGQCSSIKNLVGRKASHT